MLYLKEINFEDIEQEYEAIRDIPSNENGFENKYFSCSKDEFENIIVPLLIDNSNGLSLPEGYVPATYFFLWDNNKIVGLFKVRHSLNDDLRNGSGHIGYTVLKKFRGNGYAIKGLELVIEKCKNIIKEDEIYLSCHKTNFKSLKTQIKCGAYLVSENENEYFTRIRLNNNKKISFGLRDLKRDDWTRIKQKTIQTEDIMNEYFEGKICMLTMDEVEAPLEVDSPNGRVIIADNGYKNIIIAPKNENWWLTVMFNSKDELIESYFDITRLNNFFDKENPFFIDMKLDVCIPAGKEPVIMDEEELKEILDNKMITQKEFDMAYNVANKIIDKYNNHKEEYYNFIYSYLDKMK